MLTNLHIFILSIVGFVLRIVLKMQCRWMRLLFLFQHLLPESPQEQNWGIDRDAAECHSPLRSRDPDAAPEFETEVEHTATEELSLTDSRGNIRVQNQQQN